MARGPIIGNAGQKRLSKKATAHLPLLERGPGKPLLDAEHVLLNMSKALFEEAQAEFDKKPGTRDVAKMISISRQVTAWILELKRQAAGAPPGGAPSEPVAGGGEAADPAGAGPDVGILEAFRRGGCAGGGASA